MQNSTATPRSEAASIDQHGYRTLGLASLGGALEFYDFIIFIFFIAPISTLFFPPDSPEWLRQTKAFGIFAAGYLARPLGGIIMAHFGDIVGRKRMFTFSVALMALPTLLIGLLPTYAAIGHLAPLSLLLLRILQGAAIGGEVPGAWVFVYEHVPKKRVGYACGAVCCGLVSGILLGSLTATVINTYFTAEQIIAGGWRIPFILGALLGIIAMYLRRYLQETPVFTEMQAQKALAKALPLKLVLYNHKRAVLLSILLTWFLTAVVIVLILMMPNYLQKQLGVESVSALYANNLALCGLIVGNLVAGLITDRFGSSRTLIGGSLLLALVSSFFYYTVAHNLTMLYPLSIALGFSAGIISVVPYIIVRAFPAAVRFSGLSFSYNLSYAVFGGLTPIVITFGLQSDIMTAAYYIFSLCMLAIGIGIYLGVARPLSDDAPNDNSIA